MANIKSIINARNQKILKPSLEQENTNLSNCLNKVVRPMKRKYLSFNIILDATIFSNLDNYDEISKYDYAKLRSRKDMPITRNHFMQININTVQLFQKNSGA